MREARSLPLLCVGESYQFGTHKFDGPVYVFDQRVDAPDADVGLFLLFFDDLILLCHLWKSA